MKSRKSRIDLLVLKVLAGDAEIERLKKMIHQKEESHNVWSDQQSKIIKRLVIENKELKLKQNDTDERS